MNPPGSACRTHHHDHHPVDQYACAANHTRGIRPCTIRDTHLVTCPGANCPGCAPKPAVHGYLCRHHYEQVEDALHHHRQLVRLLMVGERAQSPVSSASTIPGPRIPLAALRLDLDAIHRLWDGDGHEAAATWVISIPGAMQALRYARAVHTAQLRHPTEPRPVYAGRYRCPGCRELTVIIDPPAYVEADAIMRCIRCGWQQRDQDHIEAVRYLQALDKNPLEKRGRRKKPVDKELVRDLARALA